MKIMSGYDGHSKNAAKRTKKHPFYKKINSENILCQYKRRNFSDCWRKYTEEDETLLLELHQLLSRQLKKTPSKRILSIITPKKEHVGSLKRHIEKRGLKALHWSSTHMGTSTSDNTRKHVHETKMFF